MRSLHTKGDVCLDDRNRDVSWRSARRWPAPTPVNDSRQLPTCQKLLGRGQVMAGIGDYLGNVG
jgi:hypothetical protein